MDDGLVLKQLQEGNEESYKQVFIRFYSPLCEYASQYVSDADAEEIVQDLMLHVWDERKRIVVNTSLKSYLFTSVKNKCLNAIRDNRYKERVHSMLYEKLKDRFEDPDFYLVNELYDNINKAIADLPESYRTVFNLSRLENKTNKDIAEQLNLSVKTIEYRMTQSLKILRTKLKDYLPLIVGLWGI